MNPPKVTTVRLQNRGIEALDLAVLLQTPEVRERFIEDFESLRLAAPHGVAPSDEQSSIRHDPSFL
jgi:hypothetical protein